MAHKTSSQFRAEKASIGADELPDTVLCLMASYLSHKECLLHLAISSRGLYLAMQLRYKSLCIQNDFHPSSLHNSQNFISIYGKNASSC